MPVAGLGSDPGLLNSDGGGTLSRQVCIFAEGGRLKLRNAGGVKTRMGVHSPWQSTTVPPTRMGGAKVPPHVARTSPFGRNTMGVALSTTYGVPHVFSRHGDVRHVAPKIAMCAFHPEIWWPSLIDKFACIRPRCIVVHFFKKARNLARYKVSDVSPPAPNNAAS